jgi:GT2 family glycosyltransferase
MDGALGQAAAVLRAHPAAALLAAQVLVGPEGRPDPMNAAMAAAPLGAPPDHAGPPVLGFLACAAVVRREAFLAVGGFNPTLHVYGEEALLSMDLAAAGWQLSYVPSLVVRHLPTTAGRNSVSRRRREIRNRLLTALLRRPPHVIQHAVTTAWRDPVGRRALADAVRLTPWALRHRRRLPPHVELAIARFEAAPAPTATSTNGTRPAPPPVPGRAGHRPGST